MAAALRLRAALRRLLAPLLAVLVCGMPGPAAADQRRPAVEDLAVIAPAFVDGIVELRQYMRACRGGDATGWNEASAILLASLGAAGLPAGLVATLQAKLAASDSLASGPDCHDATADLRLELIDELPSDWAWYDKSVLGSLGVEPLRPGSDADPRLAAVQVVLSHDLPAEARMLNCLALVEPRLFPLAYSDWDDLVDKASQTFGDAGYAPDVALSVLKPARARELLSLPADRQAGRADCAADQTWLTSYAQFNWFNFPNNVAAALGQHE